MLIVSCRTELNCICSFYCPAPVFSNTGLMLSWLLAGLRFWAVTMYSHVSAMAAWRATNFGSTSLGMKGSAGISSVLFNDRILYLPPILLIKYGILASHQKFLIKSQEKYYAVDNQIQNQCNIIQIFDLSYWRKQSNNSVPSRLFQCLQLATIIFTNNF